MIDERFRLHSAIRRIKSANAFLIWLNFILVSLSYIPEALEVLAVQIKGNAELGDVLLAKLWT